MTWQPRQQTRTAVENCAGRQVVDMDRHHLPIGIDRVDAQLEQLTRPQLEAIGQLCDAGRRVAALDHDREALLDEAAPRVVDAQHHRCEGIAARRGLPAQHSVVTERHPLGPIEQHVAEHDTIRVLGLDGVGVDLAHRCLHPGARSELRRAVRVRHGIEAVAEVGTLAIDIRQRDRAYHGRLPGREHPVEQTLANVEQPQAVVRNAGIERDPLEVTARIEHQHQRCLQVVVGDVGHTHIEGQRAVGAVRTGGHEVELHQAREVLHADEVHLIRRGERQTTGALHARSDGQ